MSFYQVYADGRLIGDPTAEGMQLIEPIVSQEVNAVPTFTFTTQPDAPADIQPRKTVITAESCGTMIFKGIAVEVSTDFFGQRTYYCEGELTYLNDTIQRPAVYNEATPRLLLEKIIAEHNRQVPEGKQFKVGVVTVTTQGIASFVANYATTMETIKTGLVDVFGGYIRLRYDGEQRVIDYISEPINTNAQQILFAENLLDFTREKNAGSVITALVPLGASIDQEEPSDIQEYVTIAQENGGLDYITDPAAVDLYGLIFGVAHFDSINDASELKKQGEAYLARGIMENMTLEVKAIDLHLTDEEVEAFKLLDFVHIESAPHNISEHLIITRLETNLADIQQNTLTLGASEYKSLTAKSNADNSDIFKALESMPTESEILDAAKRNATELLTSAMGGYVYKTRNELYIMDTDNPETAKRVWRWNINGLGYSDDGIDGPYGLAMTMDGAIVADFITSGTIYGVKYLQGDKTSLRDDKQGSYIGTDGFSLGNNALLYDSATGVISIGNGAITYNPTYQTVTMGGNVSLTWGSISDAPRIPTRTSDLTNDSGYIDSGTVTYITQNAIQTGTLHLGGNIYRMYGDYWWNSEEYLLLGINSYRNLQIGSTASDPGYTNISMYAPGTFYFCPSGGSLSDYAMTVYNGGTSQTGKGIRVAGQIDATNITASWNVSGYTITATGKIDAQGSIHYTGAGTASGMANVRLTNDTKNLCTVAESTREIKTDIGPVVDIDLAPEKLYNIEVVQFKYKPEVLPETDPRYNKMCVGLIAEQVAEQYPIAAEMETGSPRNWDVRYLFPPLLQLVQDQHKELEEIKARLAALEV